MHDLLFAHQDQLELAALIGYAATLDLDVDVFLDDLHSQKVDERVRNDVASAEASGAYGTPTFFVGSRRHTGSYDADTLTDVLVQLRVVAGSG
jgi:predicted DsbA family dithiol-disulfide isomerase